MATVVQRLERTNTQLAQEMRASRDEEEKINLEMAFLSEEKGEAIIYIFYCDDFFTANRSKDGP